MGKPRLISAHPLPPPSVPTPRKAPRNTGNFEGKPFPCPRLLRGCLYTHRMIRGDTMLSEISPTPKGQTVQASTYMRYLKLSESKRQKKSRSSETGGGGRGGGQCLGTEFQFRVKKNMPRGTVLPVCNVNPFGTTRTNCIPKNDERRAFNVMYILSAKCFFVCFL